MGWKSLEQRREYAEKYRLRRREYDKKRYNEKKVEILQKQRDYSKLPHVMLRRSNYEKSPDRKKQHRNYLLKVGQYNRWTVSAWANKVREIFSNSCQICGNKADEVHHLIYQKTYPELKLNINNGLPLCKLYHNKTHGKCLN